MKRPSTHGRTRLLGTDGAIVPPEADDAAPVHVPRLRAEPAKRAPGDFGRLTAEEAARLDAEGRKRRGA